MKINNQTYKLGINNYVKRRHSKHQIVIASTFSEDMNHVSGWKTRYGGDFKRTAAFTIDIHGNIHQHYPPEFYSEFLGIDSIDEHIIPILIENEGWLIKDIKTDSYVNYIGNTYKRKESVIESEWRGQDYWAPYTNKQLDSAIQLCKYLCNMFGIEFQTVSHNTKLDGIYDYNGVIYKSNFNKRYTDLSPAWDYTTFKNKIELN